MKSFLYYCHEPRPNRVHVAGAVPNEDHRRKTQLKHAEIVFRSGVTASVSASRRWFSSGPYKHLSPQHNAFERLQLSLGATNYQIESIHPIETDDSEQFGMTFNCTKVVSPERTANFLIRLGVFKDIVTLSANYKSRFPVMNDVRLLAEHPSHPVNELKDLLDSLSASRTYSQLCAAYEYYVTPEGFVYHITPLNPVG